MKGVPLACDTPPLPHAEAYSTCGNLPRDISWCCDGGNVFPLFPHTAPGGYTLLHAVNSLILCGKRYL